MTFDIFDNGKIAQGLDMTYLHHNPIELCNYFGLFYCAVTISYSVA